MVESGKILVWLELEGISVKTSDENVPYSVAGGKRFRKDGLRRNHTEHFSIVAEKIRTRLNGVWANTVQKQLLPQYLMVCNHLHLWCKEKV